MGFILQNMLVDPFRTNRGLRVPLEPATDLFGTPIFVETGVDGVPQRRGNAGPAFDLPPLESQPMCWPRPIPALSVVPSDFAGDGRGMDLKVLSDRRVSLVGVQQGRNLIPLFLGEVRVGSYACSFDWMIERVSAKPTAPRPHDQ
jgi:hypothetical protein